MAKALINYPNVIDMFESASDILRYNLLDLCIHGPKDMLDMTVHSQAAVMVTSLAAVEKLRAENIKVSMLLSFKFHYKIYLDRVPQRHWNKLLELITSIRVIFT